MYVWLIHGENAYSGRYRDAIEQTSLDYQTLRNYAWVARSLPLSRRRDTLSFAHHAEVARPPECEQDFAGQFARASRIYTANPEKRDKLGVVSAFCIWVGSLGTGA
jgi:hypothetical protein